VDPSPLPIYSWRMATVSAHSAQSTIEAIEDLSTAGLAAQPFIEAVKERLDRVVPNDGDFYASADPAFGLAMGAGVSTLPHEICAPFWDYEFFVPDYTKYSDLAAGPRLAADLHQATGGRPERSARWRNFSDQHGLDAELRASFTVDGATWGMAQLNRYAGSAPFSEAEVELVSDIAPIVARGLRAALMTHPGTASAERGPGMAILDGDGRLLSMTDEAATWLDDLPTATFAQRQADVLPFEIAILALAARARHAAGEAPPRMRMCTSDGVWVLVHASVLSGADGNVALVIEPAKASEVAPLIIEAYGLTPRELEVTQMIARGRKTNDIAGELFLSPHTIRDHVKAIFEKVGVSSRGELVATIFADHYHPGLDAAIYDADARLG
jgi:DNA-binding CsgD family transcriptional regulator